MACDVADAVLRDASDVTGVSGWRQSRIALEWRGGMTYGALTNFVLVSADCHTSIYLA